MLLSKKIFALLSLSALFTSSIAFARVDDSVTFMVAGATKAVSINGDANGPAQELFEIIAAAGKKQKTPRGIEAQYKYKPSRDSNTILATKADANHYTVFIEYEANARLDQDEAGPIKGLYLRILGGSAVSIRDAVVASKTAKSVKGFVNTKHIKDCGVSTAVNARKMPVCKILGVKAAEAL